MTKQTELQIPGKVFLQGKVDSSLNEIGSCIGTWLIKSINKACNFGSSKRGVVYWVYDDNCLGLVLTERMLLLKHKFGLKLNFCLGIQGIA